jgi:hypothetical protein
LPAAHKNATVSAYLTRTSFRASGLYINRSSFRASTLSIVFVLSPGINDSFSGEIQIRIGAPVTTAPALSNSSGSTGRM